MALLARRTRRGTVALVAAVAALCLAAPAAFGHAVLERTEPERGAALRTGPERVVFAFNEAVEGSFGALRVFDARGERVDTGRLVRPDGSGRAIGVGLRNGLADGTYTATYRVVSADSHPVSGGFVFTVGQGGATPSASVDELIDAGRAGPVTEVAFGAVRALAYAAIALALGGVAFLLWAWLPALGQVGGPQRAWQVASENFRRRLRLLLAVGVVTGAVTSALGIVLQGATASGRSLWAALDPSVVGGVLDTRFGVVWAARLVAWLLVGAGLMAVLSGRRAPVLRPAPSRRARRDAERAVRAVG
jgi:copper transport protein